MRVPGFLDQNEQEIEEPYKERKDLSDTELTRHSDNKKVYHVVGRWLGLLFLIS